MGDVVYTESTDTVVVHDGTSVVEVQAGAKEVQTVEVRQTGPQGPAWEQWQGAWNSNDTPYNYLDAVEHNGSSWIANKDTSEEPSSSATDWDILASGKSASEYDIGELKNVSTSSWTAGQLLIYHATNAELVNASLTEGSNVSISQSDGSITISATDTNTQTDVSDGGTTVVSSVTDINFSSNLSVVDDADGTVTVSVPDDLTVISNYSIGDLSDSALPNSTAVGQVQIWNATNGQFENATLSNGGNVTITNADASITLSVPNDLTVMSDYSTDDLSEGSSNLYFTTSRVDSHLSGGTGINYSSGTISTDDANIDHDSLSNFVSNEHIDWTTDVSASYTIDDNNINKSAVTQYSYTQSDLGISGLLSIDGVSNQDGDVDLVNGGNITITPDDSANSITLSVPNDLTVPSNYVVGDLSNVTTASWSAGQLLIYDGTNSELVNASLTAGSNVSISQGDGSITISATDTDTRTDVSQTGTQVLSDVTDINFTASGAASVSVTDDGDGSVSVDVSATDTDTTYSAGEGLALSSTTFSMDVDSLTTESSADSSGDYVPFYDSSAGAHKNITPSNLIGSTANYASVSDDGSVVVSDASDINFSSNLSVTDDGDGTVTVNVPNDLTVMSNYSTDDLSEGSSNLYHTNSRAISAINDDSDHGSTASHNYASSPSDVGLGNVPNEDATAPSNWDYGLTGADTTVVTGTSGTGGNLVEWNADGDVVDSGTATSNVLTSSSDVDHDSTTNFVSNEHIDWTVSQTENVHKDNYNPALELISEVTANSDSQIIFSLDFTTYSHLFLTIYDFGTTNSDTSLQISLSNDDGSTWENLAYDQMHYNGQDMGGSRDTGYIGVPLHDADAYDFSFYLNFPILNKGDQGLYYLFGKKASDQSIDNLTGSFYTYNAGINKVKFAMEAGDIDRGTFQLWGVK